MSRSRLASVALLFTLLAILMTWPQAVQPAGIVAHRDSWFNMWRLGWIAHQLPRNPAALFDANIYYPQPQTLAYSDALLVPAIVGAPLVWLGVSLPFVHTILVLGSFVFAGVAMWLLVRDVTGSDAAGIVAGIAFAFTPYRFDHYMHLELLWTGWMPLCLLALHRVMLSSRVHHGVLAGVLFALQTLSCIYYGVLFAAVLIPFVCFLVVASRDFGRRLPSLLAAALTSVALVLPYALPYQSARVSVGERGVDETTMYSAGPFHYLSSVPQSRVYGSFTADLGRHEKRLFPGAVASGLALAALWPPLSAVRVAYGLGLLVAVDLSFGPRGLTYGLLRDHVEVFRGLRAPARAGAIALMMLAVLAGYGFIRVQSWCRDARTRIFLAASLPLVMLLEYSVQPLELVAARRHPAPVHQWLAAQPRTTIVEWPLPDPRDLPHFDAEFAYLSTFHWHALLNGYSGNVPRTYMELLHGVRTFPATDALSTLSDAGARFLVLHESKISPEKFRAVMQTLDSRADLRRHGPFEGADGAAVVYDLTGLRR